MKKVSFLIAIFLLITGTINAQDIPSLLQNARTAFDNGNYRATVENVKKWNRQSTAPQKEKLWAKQKRFVRKVGTYPQKKNIRNY